MVALINTTHDRVIRTAPPTLPHPSHPHPLRPTQSGQHFSLFFLRWFCAVSSDIVRDAIELVFKRPLGDVYALFFGLVVGTSLTVGLVAAFVVGTCAIVALCLSFVLACGTLVGRRRGAEGADRQRALEIESD